MKEHPTQNGSLSSLNYHKIGSWGVLLFFSLFLSCEKAHVVKTYKVIEPPTGATIRIEKEENKRPNELKIAEEKDETKEVGVSDIIEHLDGNKANRVNERRDQNLLDTFPDLFGETKEFKPLFVLKATGPGTICIEGKIVGNIKIPIGKGKQKVEIYPTFKLEKLFNGFSGEEEKISIIFETETHKKFLVDKSTIQWSGPNELFLSDKNVNDLTSIIQENNGIEEKNYKQDTSVWINNNGKKIIRLSLNYDDSGKKEQQASGWQKIKTRDEILEKRKANCLDLSVLLASTAQRDHNETVLITAEEHALLGIKEKGKPMSDYTYLEGTLLLNTKTNPTTEDEIIMSSLKTAKHFITTEFKRNAKKMFALNLSEWENIYRTNPQNQQK